MSVLSAVFGVGRPLFVTAYSYMGHRGGVYYMCFVSASKLALGAVKYFGISKESSLQYSFALILPCP